MTLATLANVPPLQIATLKLCYQARERVHLPSPSANVWRGQMGYHLHRIATEKDRRKPPSLYQRLFRTPRSVVDIPDYGGSVLGPIGLAGEHVPHPFVLRHASPKTPGADRRLAPGDKVEVELILMGPAVRHLPHLTDLFEMIGADGVGSRVEQAGGDMARGTMGLTGATLHVQDVVLTLHDGTTWSLPPTRGMELYEQAAALTSGGRSDDPPGGSLTVVLRAPTRLRFAGDLVSPESFDADALAASLYRRATGMAVCYGPETPSAKRISAWQDSFKALAAPTTLVTENLRWVKDRRYSHQQERTVPAGGLAGRFRLEAPPEALRVWNSWLNQAERIHLGGGTSMGLGRVVRD